ncbi:type IV secretion system protein [Cupriavidus necator]|uniref:type IV secretion system protein n=1 Tax=Cupriavidus necator TaxID=106590 RepID=UPI003ED0A027
MKLRQLVIAIILIGVAQIAFAQSQAIGVDSVLGMIKQSMAPAISKLTAQAISWVGVFATLQFFITNYNLLKSDGDIQSVVAKMFGAVAWVGICIYIINNGPQFVQAVGDQMMGVIGTDLPSPSSIVAKTIGVAGAMSVLAIGVGAIPFVGDTAGMLLVYVALFVLGVGLLFAFKIFMLQLELGLIAMLSPLSFSFLGLSTLKDQGIAPFKALLSFGYRVILLTVILSGFNQISDIVSNTLSGITVDNFKQDGIGGVADVMLSALGAYLLLGYLTFKSDAIAATLASGSTSMGTGDVAQAAAAGAALGAAVATGGATAATSAGKVPQSMSAFMDKLMARGSISNASPMGGGGDAPVFTPPTAPAPSLSVGAPVADSTSAASPPSRPDSGTAGTPAKANVASGRYGAELPDGAGVQREAAGSASDNVAGGPTGTPESPVVQTDPGSAQTAGIGGKPNLEKDLSRLVDHLASQQQGPRKPTLGERLGEANRHVSQEQAATHVSINTHHAD